MRDFLIDLFWIIQQFAPIVLLLVVLYIVWRIRNRLSEPKRFKIRGENMPTNMTIVAGTSGDFVATPEPSGSQLLATQPLPAWTSSDSNAVLTPTSNGLGVNVAIPASDPTTSFTLTITYVRSDGSHATGTATVSVVQPTPPPPPPPSNEPTSFTITQID